MERELVSWREAAEGAAKAAREDERARREREGELPRPMLSPLEW
jgi:hypothetical protein